MKESRVASRYAKSLITLAIEKKVENQVHQDMVLFSKVCDENRDFVLVLRNPVINHDKKLKILKSLFKDKINPLTQAFFEIITRKNREAELPFIAKAFHHQYNELKGIQEATITTTFDLSNELKQKFEDVVKKLTNKTVELSEKVDKTLIGGFVLKIEDKQLDESVSTKLKSLKREFSYNPYVKEF